MVPDRLLILAAVFEACVYTGVAKGGRCMRVVNDGVTCVLLPDLRRRFPLHLHRAARPRHRSQDLPVVAVARIEPKFHLARHVTSRHVRHVERVEMSVSSASSRAVPT